LFAGVAAYFWGYTYIGPVVAVNGRFFFSFFNFFFLFNITAA